MQSLVDRLNRANDARLPAMWELVVLDALSTVGTLRHEIELPSGKRPEIELVPAVSGASPMLIVGDVATVSDAGLDELNPVGVLSEELTRLAGKFGLNPNRFGYDVRGSQDGGYGDSRMKLSLPNRGALVQLMRREVEPWVKGLAVAPEARSSFAYSQDDVAFTLTYEPNQRYGQGGYTAYDVAYSRDKNPLFAALRAKAKQLRGAPDHAIRLVVVCDGGSGLLRRSSGMTNSPGSFTARKVAEDFLRQSNTIDFVLMATVDAQRAVLGVGTRHQLRFELVAATESARSSRVTPNIVQAVHALLEAAGRQVPAPVMSADNAARRSREPGYGLGMLGGCQMSGNKISLSSLALHQLLAGEMTLERFLEAHGWTGERNRPNPFAAMARRGQMIADIDVKPGGDEDDDWLTFEFGIPDPATAPFAVPAIAAEEPSSDAVTVPPDDEP